MITLARFEMTFRRTVIATVSSIAALTIATLASTPVSASPLPLFPFIMTPAPQMQMVPQVQSAPSAEDDESAAVEMPSRLKRQIVGYATREAPGTIIIDTPNTYLYFVLGGGQAIRYGIGVGRDGFTWSGVQSITRKAEWPSWTPPAEMIARQPYLPRFMVGGPGNPLGARAMYLGGTVYRIHGTNMPETIGTPCLVRLHSPHQPGRLGPLFPRQRRHQGCDPADGPPRRRWQRQAGMSSCERMHMWPL